VNASRQKFYDLGVKETEARLTNELAGVCRDYCLKALNLTGVLAAWEWRRPKNVYYP